MHSEIFKFFWLKCIQGTKVNLVLRVQRRALFLSMSNIYLGDRKLLNLIKINIDVDTSPFDLISTSRSKSVRFRIYSHFPLSELSIYVAVNTSQTDLRGRLVVHIYSITKVQ